MIFIFSVSTPANTLESSKKVTELKLSQGVIHQVEFVFPPGCFGLLYCSIRQGSHQVFPSNAEGFIHSDDEVISFKEHFILDPGATTLVLETWNLDESFAHELIIRFGILDIQFVNPVYYFVEQKPKRKKRII